MAKPNLCYGCNRIEAPAGDNLPYYCSGCAEDDENSFYYADEEEAEIEGDEDET